MSKPNNGLITETNSQYYAGSQSFTTTAGQTSFVSTFNTDLVFGNYSPNTTDYGLNNFVLYFSTSGLPGTFNEYIQAYTVVDNTINLAVALPAGSYIVIQLKSNDGGNYGDEDAYGDAVENNYGGYEYVTLNDIINNIINLNIIENSTDAKERQEIIEEKLQEIEERFKFFDEQIKEYYI